MADTDLIVIVNQNDRVIGQASIRQARTDGLIHRIARVMIEDSAGRLLLQKRTNKMTWPNCWDNSAAGHVDAGEGYLTAAKRELFEEIGIEKVKLTKLGTYFTDTMHRGFIMKRFNRVYKVRSNVTRTTLSKSEVAEVKWFSISQVKQLIKDRPSDVTDGLRDVIARFY